MGLWIENLTPMNEDFVPANLQLERMPGPSFSRAFWVLAVSIFIFQLFSIILWGIYGFNFNERPEQYYSLLNLVGLMWYAIVTAFVLNDLESHGVKDLASLDLHWTQRNDSWKLSMYYSATVACSVILFKLFLPTEREMSDGQSIEIIVLAVIGIAIIAPVCEEIWFRGYLYQAMFNHFKRKRERLIVNAMLFASGHVLLITIPLGSGFPYYIFIVGFLLADLYERSRSIVPCVIVHAANNGTLAILELTGFNDPLGFYN